MSRQAEPNRAKKPERRAAIATRSAENRLFVFRPTDDQKKRIRGSYGDDTKNLGILDDRLQAGCKLVSGYVENTNSIYATLRANEPGIDWDQQAAVSAWHADLALALAQLAFYLVEVNPEFPTRPPIDQLKLDMDW